MIYLRAESGADIAKLGGDPNRLTGDFAAPPGAIVLERNEGSGAKAMLVAAITKHKCYYLGYQSVCAAPDATAAPDLSDGEAAVQVLVTLNVRSQPRRAAPLIGTVPKDSNVVVNLCLTTSDGIWCRADFGGKTGWMAKSVVRQQEWPVISFVNAKE
ncbi:SH3 domain-containing protein [Loktanella sp. M215]|uniref:SH3 domain-containing protein n=1 Tax=Loktanella sp. M215 TaxID=2675431 RepID=UPI001F1DCEA9|nr:SH3 domain-containing protein [Loktanella sp. M215]MCF7700734.1 SH3 domain-containing protein [Loktanella sp. M215]